MQNRERPADRIGTDFPKNPLFIMRILPETCRKHWVSAVTANPDERAVASSTDDTLAPTPAPAAAPHTMNT